jgi:hypothetical protein
MPGPASQLGFDTPRNAERSLVTSTKPTRRSTPCDVAASGVAGEGGRWEPGC